MHKVRVFAAEQKAGLETLISKSVATVHAPIRVRSAEIPDELRKLRSPLRASAGTTSVEELIGVNAPDLALIDSILVSTGWNLNDDIFLPIETWKSRATPCHKPINIGHDEEVIIGHMVTSNAVGKDGLALIATDEKDVPVEFDIEIAGVLYRALPALSERVEAIIAAAKDGKMFVSMEAFFEDFAYGFQKTATGVTHIIARTEETAFLTKCLRAYGGGGEYEGYRVGRILLGITFAGKGIVENPANPDSIIKTVAKVAASTKFEHTQLSKMGGGAKSMADEITITAAEVQVKLDEVTKTLEAETQKSTTLAAEIEALKAQKLDEKVTEVEAVVAQMNEQIKALDTAKAELQGKLDEATKRADTAEAELATIRKAARAQERLTKLAAVKTIADEKATLAELAEMTDETFAVVLKYAGEQATTTVAEVTKTEVAATTETPAEVAAATEATATEAATQALASAKAVDEPEFNAGAENPGQTLATSAKATAAFLLKRAKTEQK